MIHKSVHRWTFPITDKCILWPYPHSAHLCVLFLCDVSVCVCMCVCDMWVFQSLSPKPIYLRLPSEVAGRLPSGQSHRDERRPLHEPPAARQQTNRTNQEQEVPLLRYEHTLHRKHTGLFLIIIVGKRIDPTH